MINFLSLRSIFFLLMLFLVSVSSYADTPVDLYESHAGNINFVGAQKTRRTQSNSGNACAVLSEGTTNTTSISGIPTGSTIVAAHLYWAGSYSGQFGSTRTTPDYNVTFEGNSITADRQYTANFDTTEQYFSGAEDVTSIVKARSSPNGTYSFSGLSVNTSNPHCSFATVLSGWALVIIYDHPGEDFRVINLFEGFQLFWGESITLHPSNFLIPTSPINGKHGYVTWEGDVDNSGSKNGLSEGVTFNSVLLSDATNPSNNQYNSNSNVNGVDANAYGVDFDVFTINSLLTAGETTATSVYRTGADQVHLSMEIISVTNTPVSDLGITKTHSGNFSVGQNAVYTLTVKNNGPLAETGPIVVKDTLPAGLTFVSATGSGWSCGASGQIVTCTRSGTLNNGASASNIILTVSVNGTASPSVTNTATVSGANFDNISANNSSSDTATVISAPSITLQKTTITISDPVNGTTLPKAIPGALAEYTLTAINSGNVAADNNSIILADAIPANTALYVNDISGSGTGPVRFTDGSPPSGLSYTFTSLASATDNVSFSSDGGASYNYTPSADADGLDTNVTHIRVALQGQFLAASGSGSPNFNLKFRVKVK